MDCGVGDKQPRKWESHSETEQMEKGFGLMQLT